MLPCCTHCGSSEIGRRARSGVRDGIQNLLGRWPWVCRACLKCSWLAYRSAPAVRTPKPPADTKPLPVECTARRHNAQAAVVIRAETEGQLTNILLALSRAVEVEQRVGTRERSAASPGAASGRP